MSSVHVAQVPIRHLTHRLGPLSLEQLLQGASLRYRQLAGPEGRSREGRPLPLPLLRRCQRYSRERPQRRACPPRPQCLLRRRALATGMEWLPCSSREGLYAVAKEQFSLQCVPFVQRWSSSVPTSKPDRSQVFEPERLRAGGTHS